MSGGNWEGSRTGWQAAGGGVEGLSFICLLTPSLIY